MADLKTNWGNAPVSVTDLAGDLATSRGNDPNLDLNGASGLDPVWDEKFVNDPGDATANPVSGLPALPNRFAPSPDTPPEPPSLQDRSPSTIDQK